MTYVFDTCALLNFYKEDCGYDLESPLWKKFYRLIEEEEERIISVLAVFGELNKKGKPLADWAKKHEKTFFKLYSETETRIVDEIRITNPELVPKSRPYAADPWVIARAEVISGCVVTGDGFHKDGRDKTKGVVPVCRNRGVSCISLKCFRVKEKI